MKTCPEPVEGTTALTAHRRRPPARFAIYAAPAVDRAAELRGDIRALRLGLAAGLAAGIYAAAVKFWPAIAAALAVGGQ